MRVITIILGIIIVIAGAVCLVNPAIASITIAFVIGLSLIVSGINNLIAYFGRKEGSGWDVFFGILFIIGGGLLFVNGFADMFAVQFMAIFTAIMILMTGIGSIAASTHAKKAGASWVPILILGILATIVGVIAIINPFKSIILLDIMFSISLIMQGISMICIGSLLKIPKPNAA